MSAFESITLGPQDPVFGIGIRARRAKNPIDVSVGAYRNSQGKPVVLDVVKKVSIFTS